MTLRAEKSSEKLYVCACVCVCVYVRAESARET